MRSHAVCVVLGLVLVRTAGAWPAACGAPRATSLDVARRPLAFESASPVARGAYVARGNRFSFTIGATDAALSLTGKPVLRAHWRGGAAQATVRPVDPTGAKVHYLVGNDPRRWRTDVPTFSRVRVDGVYPGIDLVCYGTGGRLEYDWIVQPGADPGAIQMAFSGQRALAVDAHGALVISVGDGHVRHEPPVIYQETARGRRPVTGHYVRRSADAIGFAVAGYDHSRPLVIDPVLEFSTYLGSTNAETTFPHALAVDTAGASYLTGQTIFQAALPVPFPITGGAFQTSGPATEASGERAFVTKFRPDGSIEWSTFLCGSKDVAQSGQEGGRAVAVAGDFQACVVGRTTSTDFPIRNASQNVYKGATVSSFAVRLNAAGNAQVWGTYWAGSGNAGIARNAANQDSGANAVAFDRSGNAYVAGFGGVPCSAGAFQGQVAQLTMNPHSGYIAKFDANGVNVYSTLLGSKAVAEVGGIAVDFTGQAFVTGTTFPPNAGDPEFPTTAGAAQSTRAAGNTQAAFATKLNAAGSALVFSTLLSGRHADAGNGVAVDVSGNSWFVGSTTSDNFPGVGILDDRQKSMPWVLKLNSTGGASLRGASNLTGGRTSGTAAAYDVAIGPDACPVIAGETDEDIFPSSRGATDLIARGADRDGFLVKLARNAGDERQLITYTGISTGGRAHGVSVDGTGRIRVAGLATGTLPTTTPGAPQTAKPGGTDAYLMRIQGPLNNRDQFGDGSSGLLLRNDASGQTFFWSIKNERVDAGPLIGTIDARSFEVQGFNDLDGNGSPDILWRDISSGQTFGWFYDGQTFLRSSLVLELDPGWKIAGTGDFDGDGQNDIVIRNKSNGDTWVYLFLNGQVRSAVHLGLISTSFDIVATGDFDGDGIADLLLANTINGDHFFWLMNRPAGATITVRRTIFFLNLPTSFRFQGTCDANGDGRVDLILRNVIDGSLFFYILSTDASGSPTVVRAPFAGRPDPGFAFKNR